jgi:hypothetical protein
MNHHTQLFLFNNYSTDLSKNAPKSFSKISDQPKKMALKNWTPRSIVSDEYHSVALPQCFSFVSSYKELLSKV